MHSDLWQFRTFTSCSPCFSTHCSEAPSIIGENVLRMHPAHLLDDCLGNSIENHQPIFPILNPVGRNDEDAGVEFGNPDFPLPSEVAYLLISASAIDLK